MILYAHVYNYVCDVYMSESENCHYDPFFNNHWISDRITLVD